MNLSKFQFLAISLISIAATLESAAFASTSWNKQPSWASEPRTTVSRKPNLPDARGGLIAPFTPGTNNLSLDIGQVFLMGDLGGNYADNIGARLHYTYGVSDLFGFDTSLGYSDHGDSKRSDGGLSMLSLLAGVRTNLTWYDKVVPYGVFGMGFYRPSFSLAQYGTGGKLTGYDSLSSVLFGVYMGAGVDLELTRQLFFGASLTMNDAFGNPKLTSDGKSLNMGGTFTTFFIRAGVTF